MIVESDGPGPADTGGRIDQVLEAGNYFLKVAVIKGSGEYQLKATFSPRSSAFQGQQAAVGDYNGDGILDLVATDGVHLGTGDGSFLNPSAGLGLPTRFDYQSGFRTLYAGDFNGDGKLDALIDEFYFSTGFDTPAINNNLLLVLGKGDGTFEPTTYVVGHFGVYGPVITGDFNSDGKLDVAFAGGSQGAILVSNGDGTFQNPKPFQAGSAGTFASTLVAADFSGDGKLDLAVAGSGAGISVFLGDGDGTLGPPVLAGVDSGYFALVAGDFDGNGTADLAASKLDGNSTSILISSGDGTFKASTDLPLPTATNSTSVGDFNGDGKLDFEVWGFPRSDVQTNLGFQFQSFLVGNGDGTFQTPRATGQNAGLQVAHAIVGDFNNDGKLDLFEPHVDPSERNYFEIESSYALVFGNGDGTFQATAVDPTATIPSLVALGDFDGDGRADLAVTSSYLKNITILLGDGQGGYRVGEQIPSGTIGTISAADVNRDGRLDLVTDLGVLLGDGDGTFQTLLSSVPRENQPPSLAEFDALLPGFTAISFQEGDFNHDGDLDAAVLGNIEQTSGFLAYLPGLVVFLSDGKGGFTPSQTIGASVSNYYSFGPALVGDFNGDGKLDLDVFTPTYPPSVSFYAGNGDGSFAPAVNEQLTAQPDQYGYSPIVPTSLVLAGDLNSDGTLDLIALDNYNKRLFMLGGNGSGAFEAARIVSVSTSFDNVFLGDLNGDGRPDLIFPNSTDGSIATLLNNGDGSFSEPGQVITAAQNTPLLADVNGDGTADALVLDGNGNILLREGNPLAKGSYLPPAIAGAGFPSRALAWVPGSMVGPLLASVDAKDDAVSLYIFRNGAFARFGSLATGRIPAQIFATDLNRDGWDDLVVRTAGDGSLLAFLNNGPASFATGFDNPFRPAITTVLGQGVSDLEMVDTTGEGLLDVVTTDALSGQLSVQQNRGNGAFAPPVLYRAGIGTSTVKSGAPEVTSMEATAGSSGGSLTAGSPISLIVANPGSSTITVLPGIGSGQFSYPVVVAGSIKASVIRSADLNHDGVLDLAVLDDHGVSVLLGDGKGGFRSPETYAAGPDPTGLLVADANGNGTPDLLVGNPYGDFLVLLNQGNGSFAPYRNTDQSVALAVADLKGDGTKDVIYADQGLDRVIVDYGAGNSTVLGDHSSGVLSPGAVKLADLNGDGIPDLIVANSGSNNVLVYPGLGDGQFGPATNGGHGFFTGTNPTGLDVADLNDDGIPDLVVADAGSNDVSVLLGQGRGAAWSLHAGPRIKTDAGPVAVAVGRLLGSGQLDLAVANGQANTVQVFPGVGNGFFNDTAPRSYPVGQAPSGLFLGNFTGAGPSIATLNSGSNTISLIGPGGAIQTISAGGLRPVSGFAGDFGGNGFTDLVVGDNGDGRYALFAGGPGGLSLTQTITSAEAPSPTSLSFAGVNDGVLSFYASTAGRETASLLAFNLEAGANAGGSLPGEGLAPGTDQSTGSLLASATAGLFQQVAGMLNLTGSTLDLLAPLFTVSVIPGEFDVGTTSEGGIALLANFSPGPVTSGQALRPSGGGPVGDVEGAALSQDGTGTENPGGERTELPPWAGMAMAIERAWEQMRIGVLEKAGISPEAAERASAAPKSGAAAGPAGERPSGSSSGSNEGTSRQSGPSAGHAPALAPERGDSEPPKAASYDLIDLATHDLITERDLSPEPERGPSTWFDELSAVCHGRLSRPNAVAVTIASATTIAALVRYRPFRHRSTQRISGPSGKVPGKT